MQKAHLCKNPCEGRARQKTSGHHKVLRNFCFAGVDAYGERTDPVSYAPRLPVWARRHHPARKLVASESRCGARVGEWRRNKVLQGFPCCLSRGRAYIMQGEMEMLLRCWVIGRGCKATDAKRQNVRSCAGLLQQVLGPSRNGRLCSPGRTLCAQKGSVESASVRELCKQA